MIEILPTTLTATRINGPVNQTIIRPSDLSTPGDISTYAHMYHIMEAAIAIGEWQ